MEASVEDFEVSVGESYSYDGIDGEDRLHGGFCVDCEPIEPDHVPFFHYLFGDARPRWN